MFNRNKLCGKEEKEQELEEEEQEVEEEIVRASLLDAVDAISQDDKEIG